MSDDEKLRNVSAERHGRHSTEQAITGLFVAHICGRSSAHSTLTKLTKRVSAGVAMNADQVKVLSERVAALEAENARLLQLEKSILLKARNLKAGGWDLSDEDGAAGEIHEAITAFWIEMEIEVAARQALEKKLAPQ